MDDGTIHATVWRGSAATDLGTLGGDGSSSAVLWPVKNNAGLVVGISHTDTVDPNNEPWSCSAFLPQRPGYACAGFVWSDGEMHELPTLGGAHGFAAAANNHGQIVGWAENTVVDDTCTNGQVLQFRAVRWDWQGQQATELDPLPGDRVSSATAINDAGRIVGISGICDQAVGRSSARSAVVWDQDRSPRQLADLGGVAWNTPMSLNHRGDIVGFLNRSEADGTRFRPVAAMWTANGTLHRLDPPPGFAFGQALGINGQRQIVGVAFPATETGTPNFAGCAAVLWERGEAILLSDRATTAGLDLCTANDINDRGEIAGRGTDPEAGGAAAFVASRAYG